jgi:hypothetical protein
VPFNTLLGMRLHQWHRDGVTIGCTHRNNLRNSVGAAHGGAATAMADAAVGIALQRHFGGKRRIATTSIWKGDREAADFNTAYHFALGNKNIGGLDIAAWDYFDVQTLSDNQQLSLTPAITHSHPCIRFFFLAWNIPQLFLVLSSGAPFFFRNGCDFNQARG